MIVRLWVRVRVRDWVGVWVRDWVGAWVGAWVQKSKSNSSSKAHNLRSVSSDKAKLQG